MNGGRSGCSCGARSPLLTPDLPTSGMRVSRQDPKTRRLRFPPDHAPVPARGPHGERSLPVVPAAPRTTGVSCLRSPAGAGAGRKKNRKLKRLNAEREALRCLLPPDSCPLPSSFSAPQRLCGRTHRDGPGTGGASAWREALCCPLFPAFTPPCLRENRRVFQLTTGSAHAAGSIQRRGLSAWLVRRPATRCRRRGRRARHPGRRRRGTDGSGGGRR